MKKLGALASAGLMMLALAGCSDDKPKENEKPAASVVLDPPAEGKVNVTGKPTEFVKSQIEEFYKPGGAELDCYYYAPHSLEVFYGTEDAEGLEVCQEANKVAAGQIKNPDLSRLKAKVVKDVPEEKLSAAGIGIRDKLLSYTENEEPTIVHLSGVIVADGKPSSVDNYYYVKQYKGEWRQILNITL